MDNTKQTEPSVSGIYIPKPTKEVFQNPCKKCLIRACCSVLCMDRIDYFGTLIWKEFEENNEKRM